MRISLPPSRVARAAVAAGAALVALSSCVSVPRLEEALAQSRVAQTTKVYAADGSLITELHAEEHREVIALDAMPDSIRNAVISIEDARFYKHAGVDYYAVARALSRNASEGKIVEGGSTITQQLVKNTLVTKERTVKRKIREAVLAYQLEQRFSKDEILERYLNTVYFGRGAYGVQAAAETYFQKAAKDLTLVESALLAGLIRSPSRYDPAAGPRAARDRRNLVLDRMREEGFITAAEFRRARREPVRIKPKPERDRYSAAYFVDYVKEMIFDDGKEFRALGASREERINALFKGGLRIHTTMEPRLQRAAERAQRQVLRYKSDPYTSFVGMNPKTGAIVSMVGGRDFFDPKDRYAKYNLAARRPGRQPGSSFKPFTLAAAVERGIPLSRAYRGGSRVTVRLPSGLYWSPRNYEGRSFCGSCTLRQATAFSINVVYAQLVVEVGPQKVVEMARRLGVGARMDPVAAITLGTEEVTPLDMATAYSAFANGGYRVRPTAIAKITDAEGTVIYEPRAERKRVIQPAVAGLVTEALQDVMRYGTGQRLGFGRPAAGKTGTSEEYHDAWFAGFTPQWVGVRWVGFPRAQIPMRPPRTRRVVYGSSWPGEMWRLWMIEAHKGLPKESFPKPDTDGLMVRVKVDSSRGCLPNDFTPPYLIREQTYLRGSEPKEVCKEPTSGDIPSTPSVVGKSAASARQTLETAGFAVSTVYQYCPAFGPGTVCDQTPSPGTRSTVGARAIIYVSNDQAVAEVPLVLGRTVARATQKLTEAGYRVRVVYRKNDDGYRGCRQSSETGSRRVWLQDPCGGANYGRGSTVTILANP